MIEEPKKINIEELLPVYLSQLEKAKCDLDRAEKSSSVSSDPIEKVRWSLEAEVCRSLVRVYEGLINFLQAHS